MSKVGETVKHVNTSLRTLIAGGALLLVAAGSYKGYQLFVEPREALNDARTRLTAAETDLREKSRLLTEQLEKNQELRAEVEKVAAENVELSKDNERLTTSIRLMRLKHRLARVTVREQTRDEEGNIRTKFDFVEINEEGQPVGDTQTFEIDGDRVYVEFRVVKFDDSYVTKADIERGTAICLIERVFGERQQPADGYRIDHVGTQPTGYDRGLPVTEFEQQIWDDFWTIANDRARAEELGIRAIQAEAPSLRVVEGRTYEIDIRSTGDFSFLPVSE